MRKNSIKNTRINGEVQKELSRIISREIKDPRISPMTSVVAVEVSNPWHLAEWRSLRCHQLPQLYAACALALCRGTCRD